MPGRAPVKQTAADWLPEAVKPEIVLHMLFPASYHCRSIVELLRKRHDTFYEGDLEHMYQ